MSEAPDLPALGFQFDRHEARPEPFAPSEWTVIKRARDIVAARHTSGVVRKMPARWLED